MEQWVRKIRSIVPLVVEVGSTIAAYGDLQPTGYIDHFFVSGRFARRRIGTALMEHLLFEASTRGIRSLTSDVSMTAQPFFERFGFQVVEYRLVTIRGAQLRNARMQRSSSTCT